MIYKNNQTYAPIQQQADGLSLDDFIKLIQIYQKAATEQGWVNLHIEDRGSCDYNELTIVGNRPETEGEKARRIKRKEAKAQKEQKKLAKELEAARELLKKHGELK